MWTFEQYKKGFVITPTKDPRRLQSFFAHAAFSCVVWCGILIFLPVLAPAQRNDILEVKALKTEIRARYSLTERELLKIEPLIDQEGRKLIKMYARFSGGDEAEYSSRVWDQIIEDRSSFESTLSAALSKRQREAVRSARSRMEKRVLGYLVDDYLSLLTQALELSDLQSNEMIDLFDSDTTKKLQLIALRLGDVPNLQKALENVTESTERSVKGILTADQWRMYCQMKENAALVG